MQIINSKKIFGYLRLIIFFIIIAYLVFKAEYNFDQIYEKINAGFFSIVLIRGPLFLCIKTGPRSGTIVWKPQVLRISIGIFRLSDITPASGS